MAFIQRFLGALQEALQSRPSKTSPTGAQAVGTGACNEVHIEIGGMPNLFRDEGERIVHFVAAFDARPTSTRFGQKLLPDPVPYWSVAGEHHDAELASVIAGAIRDASPAARMEVSGGNGAGQSAHVAQPGAHPEPAAPAKASARRDHGSAVYRGTIAFWGDAEFPDRKRVGSTYTSFALKLETAAGTVETLQGEGLKDAIAEASCQVGDRVDVRRLKKVKVPAFHRISGKPKLDASGQQILWDKWLWSIARSN
ncbi:hypothetical protein Tamer19_13540 [Cupriavidus sp. TA19]|uniref:hypothetical protein n=1 Tax=unclassified Cupriavidus TaxID=2640874 RepID=UPI0027294740|nr:hypothetical protein [Cupriavidus sp. TA19]GLC91946.1 hypothetical protein Tamer19_13540 [Cupriavidus sp. TA19]